MEGTKLPAVALVWTQFAPHHVDRSAALAKRIAGQARVIAIEVATTSRDYADFGSAGGGGGAERRTLFPDRSFDEIPRWRRLLAVLRQVAGCRTVCIGVPYSELDFVLLAWLLRLLGKQVVLLNVSKFDDYPRSAGFEFLKQLGLSCFSAVVVPGVRGREFFRYLGFVRRPAVAGGNTIAIARVRAAAGGEAAGVDYAARDFVYVGRFIAKKNLSLLIEAFARYCEVEGPRARRLVLIGSGPLEAQLRREAAAKVPAGKVVFTGFLAGEALYSRLAEALALVLVSTSEQWGLVVNEALALGIPVIASDAPGARDILIRNLVNGYVVEPGSAEGIAEAMHQLGAGEAAWQAMSQSALTRAPLGDVAVFAEAVAGLLGYAGVEECETQLAYRRAIDEFDGGGDAGGRASKWGR